MGDAESNAAFSAIIEIFLIEEIYHIESQQHFLIVPWQCNRVGDRRIVDCIGIFMRGIGPGPLFRSPQSGAIQHLTGQVRPLQQSIAQDG